MCRKLIYLYLISFVLVLGLAGYAAAVPGDPLDPVLIPAAGQAPVIDGVRDALWGSPRGKCNILANGVTPTDANDLYGTWWALWDSQYLYVLMDVNDDVQVKGASGTELWAASDSVEIMIDIGNDKMTTGGGADDYQHRFGWAPDPYTPIPKPTANYNGEEYFHPTTSMAGVVWCVKTRTDPNGYTLEVKLPWTSLNIQNRPGEGPPA